MNASKKARILCARAVLLSLVGSLGFAQGPGVDEHWYDGLASDDVFSPIARFGEVGIAVYPPLAKLHVFSDAPLPTAIFEGTGNVGIGTTSPVTALHIEKSGTEEDVGFIIQNLATVSNAHTRLVAAVNGSAAGDPFMIFEIEGFGLTKWSVGLDNDDEDKFKISQSSQLGTSDRLVIDTSGNVGIGTTAPSERLHVAGNICATGTIGACSDRRFKADIEPLENALATISQLRGVRFAWKQDDFPQWEFSDGKQIGFIAQEVQEVLPEVVSEGNDGFYSMDYGRMTAVLVEAVKELKAENETLKAQKEELTAKQIAMEQRLAALEQAIAASAND